MTVLPLVKCTALPVQCDHGATSFTDPGLAIPEAARVLRSGGLLVFNIATPFIWTFWGEDDEPPGRELRRPYFGGGRTVWADPDPSVAWQLTYGEWIRVFRSNGLVVEDLIELRPSEDATTTYQSYSTLEWSRDFPAEHIWKVRKA